MADDVIDDNVLALARAGDAAAWERLLRAFHGRLLGFVDRLMPADVRALVEPQDVLNDTCFEAYQRFGDFEARDPDAVYRWLATIARHRLIDLVRAQRAEKRGGSHRRVGAGGDGGEDDPVVRLLQELAVYERTPSQSAMRHELRLALERAIDRLAAPLRDAVRLRHVHGLPFKDVAERMGRTERAVQQLCTRGLGEMRTHLASASLFV
ncbi:MAG: sigH 1 [Phycisphaerales bacterium]|nr:sigH 1 [Phycisphaerales bacterium]